MPESYRLSRTILFVIVLASSLCALLSPPALAGTISLAWDSVSHPNLAGYRIRYGTAPGSHPSTADAGTATQATLSGLTDCTAYYMVVKAYASDGTESQNPSNELSGWPRPTVASASPTQVQRNSQVSLVLGGANFQPGASVHLSNAAITVGGATVSGCNQLTVSLTVSGTAALGPVNVEVVNPGQVFGSATGLITVVADSTAPVISAVQSVAGTTTATVSWTTSEPSDSQVFFRRQGETVYQQTPIVPAPVTDHAVTLSGLPPETTYEYYVRSSDGSGNAATSAQGTIFTTLDSSFTYIRIEAESGALVSPVRSSAGSGAFRGAWIDTPSGTPVGSTSNPAGTAALGFHVPHPATWRVWIRMYGANANSNAWFEEVDGAGFQNVQTTLTGAWEWISGRSYSLAAGLHTLRLGGREPAARVDRILVTDDPNFLPTEQPGSDVAAPPQVSGLAAAPGDGLIDLNWTDPSGADASRVIVRYRTSGGYPLSPADGFPLFEGPVVPGGPRSHRHSGLSNGTAYSYSVFTVDAAGNASNPVSVQATPLAPVGPPGQVQNLRRTDVH